ncbi:TraR/DksA family transcriptional regulator [Microbacterium terrisoli]|jgi:RNA polymerase-binding transcription factor DksA|uniref:TraR/DksA family transcriptional regulator n=1 Tax=Microbacterium terrisoli TaxID=3242192 RepID=UPI002803EE6F|nr:TraR/DksA C4-type zinc finger protein [Microbacterium protaetiae]
MDEAHRAEFAELLRRRIDESDATLAALEQDLNALADARADATADDEHDPEGVTLSAEWSRIAGLRDEQLRERAEVHAAQERWDAETYGTCVSCGRPIPVGRLRIRPMATRCVACAQREER